MEELINTIKKLASKRREISLIEIRKYDFEYEQAMDKIVKSRNRYEGMNLAPDHKETIDVLLDEVEVMQVNPAYLTGLAGCLLILDRLQMIQL